jgi:2-polyprenyl-6-methoxyphenol hydroxylase-like FAD-dependent oxidoreductase
MYDVIIVGARCAGSPLGMLLAKQGHRVLVVDRSTFPSDIMSTHFIQPDGVKRLQDWGLYDAVMATNCPSIPNITFTLNGTPIVPPRDPALREAVCPRRTVLDKILVDAARNAGAEIREGFSLQEVLVEDGVVKGIRGRGSDGLTVEELARVTVGADGQHSIVARAVVRHGMTHPAMTSGYYTYFSGRPAQDGWAGGRGNDAGVPFRRTTTDLYRRRRRARVLPRYRADIEGTFFRLIDQASPAFVERVRAGSARSVDRDSRHRELLPAAVRPRLGALRGRRITGPLVTGLGIADAFRDAEFPSEGLDAGLSGVTTGEALPPPKRRDVAAKPMAYDGAVRAVPFDGRAGPNMQQAAQSAEAAPAS